MRKSYNNIVGQSLERLAALSDGIFAVAMTLLVLDLSIPASDVIHSQQPLWMNGSIESESALWSALVKLLPRLLTYLMSFLTLGIFWFAQQTQLTYFARCNRTLAWIHLIFLLAVSLMPFPTSLLADFITYRLALAVYWLNLLLLGVMLFSSLRYATRSGLLTGEATEEILSVNRRRIITYQLFYVLAALLCVINTYVSIVLLVLFQLNSVIAPRVRLFSRS